MPVSVCVCPLGRPLQQLLGVERPSPPLGSAMTSQQPQVPNAVVPPQLAHNSSAQPGQPQIQANQQNSSQSGAAALDSRALSSRPGCSDVANRNISASVPDASSPRRDRGFEPWPEEAVDNSHGLYSLHRMFDIIGAQLTHRDVRVLSFLFVDVIDEYERGGIRSGKDFLLALERQGRCDETNFRHVLQLLRIITRHDLLPYVTLRKRHTGELNVTCVLLETYVSDLSRHVQHFGLLLLPIIHLSLSSH